MIFFFDAAILAALGFLILQLTYLGRSAMSTQAQVDALTAQVAKVQGEVVAAKDALTAQVVSLQDQLAAAGVTEQVDLSGLQAAVQSLDDINPDPAPEVVEELPTEVVEELPAEVPADPPF